jgi:hypothetical protein
MAKAVGIELERQLAEIKSRASLPGRNDPTADALLRLSNLKFALLKLGADAPFEVYRHFPVAGIAVLESAFRGLIAAIVDTDGAYLERGLMLAKDKVRASIEVLAAIHRKSVSLGELVAYGLPFNSIATMEAPLTSLFREDFKLMVAQARSPHSGRSRRAEATPDDPDLLEPIVSDVEALWRGLAKAFEWCERRPESASIRR